MSTRDRIKKSSVADEIEDAVECLLELLELIRSIS